MIDTFSNELRAFLLTHEPLIDLIGNRLYPSVAPEGTEKPYVCYYEVSNTGWHDIPVAHPRFQFSVFHERYLVAKNVAVELRNILQRYKGQIGNTRVIQGVWEGSRELYEPDTQLHHIATDFRLIYRESDR